MVPRSTTVAWLCDRIDEYHRRNPGQMIAQMLFQVVPPPTVSFPNTEYQPQALRRSPTQQVDQRTMVGPTRADPPSQQSHLRPEIVSITQSSHQNSYTSRSKNVGQVDSEAARQAQHNDMFRPQETQAVSQEVRQELAALMMIGEVLDLPTKEARRRKEAIAAAAAQHMPAAFAAIAHTSSANETARADPSEAYLCKEEEDTNQADIGIAIAAESSALRAIPPIGVTAPDRKMLEQHPLHRPTQISDRVGAFSFRSAIPSLHHARVCRHLVSLELELRSPSALAFSTSPLFPKSTPDSKPSY